MGVLSGPIRRVACAVSGGVDSAVSAYFLKRRGFDVVGVFMTNWDQQDESINCSTDVDREDARFICRTLGIKFAEVNFVKDYWNDVFVPTVESYSKGKTPNPDILCNRYVKFPKLAEITLKSSKLCHPSICADAFATGHYARNSYGNFLEKRSTAISPPQLLRSADPVKDQTFWLCNVRILLLSSTQLASKSRYNRTRPWVSVAFYLIILFSVNKISWKHLQHCMFPIGDLTKPEVKKIATSIGLERIAKRRESMGICFIGKRNFGDFIDKYVEPKKGQLVELGTGKILGEHAGVHHFTLGQRVPGVTCGQEPFYVAKLVPETQNVFIVQGAHHPSLFTRKCWTDPAFWIAGVDPPLPSDEYEFQWQNKWRPVACKIRKPETPLSTPQTGLSIQFHKPLRCIAPGQYAALYKKDVCLGGAMIRASQSLFEEGQTEPYVNWRLSDFELHYSSV
ncbi:unnamed protein product [Mesocestoides corti]|uniref:tRNA-5-taurinomethyluridine 2-sulfurtransferase n=1 Tax=Mesocestoides corti TaxID=53468 RepID=A0A0R3U1F4_MESCO|nr:unnamed protein product [Mesocestoides corti]